MRHTLAKIVPPRVSICTLTGSPLGPIAGSIGIAAHELPEADLDWLRGRGVDQFVKADVRDARAMDDVIGRHADADAVLHLAAQLDQWIAGVLG